MIPPEVVAESTAVSVCVTILGWLVRAKVQRR